MIESKDNKTSSKYKRLLIFAAILFVLFFRVVAYTVSKFHSHSYSEIPSQVSQAEVVAYVKSIKPSPMRDGNMIVILKDLNGREYTLSSVPRLLNGIKEGDIADVNVNLGNLESIKLVKN